MTYQIRNNEVCDYTFPYIADDPSDFLNVSKKRNLILIDGNGFSIPFQRVDSNKILFILNIPIVNSSTYTFRTTKLQFSIPRLVRYFTNDAGDFLFENEKVILRLHSSKTKSEYGASIDYIAKSSSSFIDSLNVEKLDSYKETITLGCGGIAPYVDGHLVRYGNFEKYEVLQDGPIFLKVKFVYPEIVVNNRKVHEERTVSFYSSLNFSKIESCFVGADSLSVAIGMPYKNAAGNPVDSGSSKNPMYEPVYSTSKGYICYAENAHGQIGTNFSSICIQNGKNYEFKDVDGHMTLIMKLDSTNTAVYYQGAATSLRGMNYKQWTTLNIDFVSSLRGHIVVQSYKNE